MTALVEHMGGIDCTLDKCGGLRMQAPEQETQGRMQWV